MVSDFVSETFVLFFDGVQEVEGPVSKLVDYYRAMEMSNYDMSKVDIFEHVPEWDHEMYCRDGEFLTVSDLEDLLVF